MASSWNLPGASAVPQSASWSFRIEDRQGATQAPPGFANRFFQYINITPPDQIPAKVYELCQVATPTAECVTGVSGCILAWKPHCEISVIIRAMADAYCQRTVNPQSKLAIMYIFNDCVQKQPLDFSAPGYRFFLEVIAPLVTFLPPEARNAHTRVIEILKDRGLYTKDQIVPLRKSFIRQDTSLKSSTLQPINQETLFVVEQTPASVRGKIEATIRASKAFCSNPTTADPAMDWADSLLSAAGVDPCSGGLETSVSTLEPDTRTALLAAVTRALKFASYEIELLQYLILDWCVSVDENSQRLTKLADWLDKEIPPDPQSTDKYAV